MSAIERIRKIRRSFEAGAIGVGEATNAITDALHKQSPHLTLSTCLRAATTIMSHYEKFIKVYDNPPKE